jgi:hypothetical protein
VFCLFKVITRGGVLQKRTIKVISGSIGLANFQEDITESLMLTTLEHRTIDLFEQRRIASEICQPIIEPVGVSLYNG